MSGTPQDDANQNANQDPLILRVMLYAIGVLVGWWIISLYSITEIISLPPTLELTALRIWLGGLVGMTIGFGTAEYFGWEAPVRIRQTLAFIYGFDVGGGLTFIISLLHDLCRC